MKRYVFLILFLIPYICWAQLYVGVRSGYSTLTKISFKPSYKATNLPSENPDIGLIFKFYNDKWVGLQGEANITQRGYNMPYKDTAQIRHINNYLEMPFFFQAHLNIAAGLYAHFGAGCYAAYLISARQGSDTTGTMVIKSYHLNILRDNRFDYGLIGGAGLSYEFGWGVLQVEARVMYGYADLYKYNYENNPEQSKAVVQNVSFSYLYNISKIGQKKKQKSNQ
jgi:hypothetical protein